MSADGAHLGVSAARALDTILGGKPSPSADEQMDAETFRIWIKTADREDSYGEAARLCARYLLEYLTAHPEDSTLPLDPTYNWDRARAELGRSPDSIEEMNRYRTGEGLWDRAAAVTPQLRQMDLTGFMVGWAFNAARRCLELPPAANPAILTVAVEAPDVSAS
jgi:hypothetical protein